MFRGGCIEEYDGLLACQLLRHTKASSGIAGAGQLSEHQVRVQVRVRFDVEEALEELTQLDLIERVGSKEGNGDGKALYACVEPEAAMQHLQNTWESILQNRLHSVKAPAN